MGRTTCGDSEGKLTHMHQHIVLTLARARSEKLGGKIVEAVDWLAAFVTRYSATWNFMHGTYAVLSPSFYLEYLTTLPAFLTCDLLDFVGFSPSPFLSPPSSYKQLHDRVTELCSMSQKKF